MEILPEIKDQVIKQIEEMMKSSTTDILKEIDIVLNSGSLNSQDIEDMTINNSYVFAKLLITAYFNYKPYAPNKTQNKFKALLKQIEYSI
jgi:hypothetical protein